MVFKYVNKKMEFIYKYFFYLKNEFVFEKIKLFFLNVFEVGTSWLSVQIRLTSALV